MIVRFTNFILRKIKGDGYCIDSAIPSSYIIRLLLSKLGSLVYGQLRLRTLKRVFINPDTTIKCSRKIKTGNNLVIERKCYIDALSKEGLVFGDNVSLGYQTFIRITGTIKELGRGIKIGSNVGLGTHGYYGCGVGYLEIGDDCIFGNYVSIHPENHNASDISMPIRLQGVNSRGG